jgi:hypothetical protein
MFFVFFIGILYVFHFFGCQLRVEIVRRRQDETFKCFVWTVIAEIFREV